MNMPKKEMTRQFLLVWLECQKIIDELIPEQSSPLKLEIE